MKQNNPQLTSKSKEHYTPNLIVEKARKTLGEIDLDPASDETANSIIRAKRFFSKEEDTLTLPWEAESIWLNPPGGKHQNRSLTAMFWDKLISEYRLCNFPFGLFLGFSLELIPKRPEVLTFPTLFFGVDRIKGNQYQQVMTGGGRIKFLDTDLSIQKSPTHGSFLTFLGNVFSPEYERFQENFGDMGTITHPVHKVLF